VPAGRIESQQREFSVTARTDLNTVAQFSRHRAEDGQRLHRAPARRGARRGGRGQRAQRVRLNGVPSISTGIIRNATANPLEVAGRRARADAADPARPAAGVTVVQANDNSVFIDRSIKSVYTTVAKPWCWWRWWCSCSCARCARRSSRW
jgi:multidrug efflux pump